MQVIDYGAIYTSATLTGNGNSGWFAAMPTGAEAGGTPFIPVAGMLTIVGSAITGDETMDLDLNWAYTAAGLGDCKVCDITQLTAAVLTVSIVLPVGLSVAAYAQAFQYPMGPYWKFTWTLAGAAKSMGFTAYLTAIA